MDRRYIGKTVLMIQQQTITRIFKILLLMCVLASRALYREKFGFMSNPVTIILILLPFTMIFNYYILNGDTLFIVARTKSKMAYQVDKIIILILNTVLTTMLLFMTIEIVEVIMRILNLEHHGFYLFETSSYYVRITLYLILIQMFVMLLKDRLLQQIDYVYLLFLAIVTSVLLTVPNDILLFSGLNPSLFFDFVISYLYSGAQSYSQILMFNAHLVLYIIILIILNFRNVGNLEYGFKK